MRVRLTEAGICGAQLREEIEAAIGETLGALDVVYYPDTHEVELPDRLEAHRATIEAVVQAHVPDTSKQVARNAARQQFVELARSMEGKNIVDATTDEKLALVVCHLFAAGVIDNQGNVRPVEEWLR